MAEPVAGDHSSTAFAYLPFCEIPEKVKTPYRLNARYTRSIHDQSYYLSLISISFIQPARTPHNFHCTLNCKLNAWAHALSISPVYLLKLESRKF